MLEANGLPPELIDSIDPAIAQMLLAEVGHCPAAQLRHELRLLRDLHQAESAKLAKLSQNDRDARVPPPSAGTWTDQHEERVGFSDEAERAGHLAEMSAKHRGSNVFGSNSYIAKAADPAKMDPRQNVTLLDAQSVDDEQEF